MKPRTHHQPGFTFVELLFAIVIMGTMLSLTMVVVVGMIRFYVFTNQQRQNQENGRNVLDSITRDIRFGTLITPVVNDFSANDSICVLNPPTNKLTKYSLASNQMYKTIYTYNPLTSMPTSCNDSDGRVKDSTKIITLDRMYIPAGINGFSVTLTKGAHPANFTDAKAVIIKFRFLTGNHYATGSCVANNIYCGELVLNTALNIRGK